MTILEEIARTRRERMKKEGFALKTEIPEERQFPVVPFLGQNGLICEVKRRSPSRGIIHAELVAAEQAGLYEQSGAGNISVLTEENYFGGSLTDLMEVKEACPERSVLRKDFLLFPEEIDVTYRIGADAFLLIAALLEDETLADLFHKGSDLGMTPLVEIHNEEELQRIAPLKPPVVGINCRDLKTFKLDRLSPIGLMARIDWDCKVVYESGIFSAEEGRFVLGAGFSGILVGEGVVRIKGLAAELAACFDEAPRPVYRFWKKLLVKKKPGRPLVKICGLTREEDARLALDCGADMLGFILAPSPRKTTVEFIASLKDLQAIKIGVVVLKEGEDLPEEIQELLDKGLLDGIQFHGSESSNLLLSYPGYKTLRIRSVEDLEQIKHYGPSPVLLEAYREGVTGGPGTQLAKNILEQTNPPLWLAGGLKPQNIKAVLDSWNPYLVDASSGLETEPGIKDPLKVMTFFKEIDTYEAG